jgi:glucosyl-3-phosphoglycerate phosphatase
LQPIREAPDESTVVFAMKNRIYLARHGETSMDARGLLLGRLDPPLTKEGRAQALALAVTLMGMQLRLIVASPLRRAAETARVVAHEVGLDVEIDDRFIDRDYGVLAGKSPFGVEERWGSIDRAPGVESPADVLSRSLSAFKDFAHHLGDKTGLIVSHDAVNRPLLVAFDSAIGGRTLAQQTGCYNVLRRADERWTVVSINNIPPSRDADR